MELEGGATAGRRTGEVERVANSSEVHPFVRDQSNTSLLREERELLKRFRRIEAVSTPELEMQSALQDSAITGITAPRGVVGYHAHDRPPTTHAVHHPSLHNTLLFYRMPH